MIRYASLRHHNSSAALVLTVSAALSLVPAGPVLGETVQVAPGVRITKKMFPVPANEQPFFGFIEKTPAMQAADKKFIETVVSAAGTKDKAFGEVESRAWNAVQAGRVDEASRRFNQAFLLDPARSGIYHGWAVVVHVRFADAEYADELFRVAKTRHAPLKTLNADYGRFLMITNRPREAQVALEQAVRDTPDFATAWSNLAAARLVNGDSKGACAAIKEAERRSPSDVKSDLAILRGKAECP